MTFCARARNEKRASSFEDRGLASTPRMKIRLFLHKARTQLNAGSNPLATRSQKLRRMAL